MSRTGLIAVLFLSGLFLSPFKGSSQELNAEVSIRTQQVRNAQAGIFQELEEAVRDFMNNTQWTQQQYEPQERIDCNILIRVENRNSAGSFSGRIQVQSGRAVYNSSYNSTILNYNDKNFDFEYRPNTTLRFSINRYRQELSSVLAYYAYLIIGMDYDTYSLKGGTPYYEKAQTIVSNAQNQGRAGWDPQQSNNNRYWLVDNLLNDAYEPLRQCFYTYHRKGLDVMYEDPKKGRQKVADALMKLEKLHERRPGNFLFQLFFTAKQSEIVKIFQKGDAGLRNKVSNFLQRIDPSNSSKYKQISAGR